MTLKRKTLKRKRARRRLHGGADATLQGGGAIEVYSMGVEQLKKELTDIGLAENIKLSTEGTQAELADRLTDYLMDPTKPDKTVAEGIVETARAEVAPEVAPVYNMGVEQLKKELTDIGRAKNIKLSTEGTQAELANRLTDYLANPWISMDPMKLDKTVAEGIVETARAEVAPEVAPVSAPESAPVSAPESAPPPAAVAGSLKSRISATGTNPQHDSEISRLDEVASGGDAAVRKQQDETARHPADEKKAQGDQLHDQYAVPEEGIREKSIGVGIAPTHDTGQRSVMRATDTNPELSVIRDSPPAGIPEGQWACQACTLDNDKDSQNCAACGSHRESDSSPATSLKGAASKPPSGARRKPPSGARRKPPSGARRKPPSGARRMPSGQMTGAEYNLATEQIQKDYETNMSNAIKKKEAAQTPGSGIEINPENREAEEEYQRTVTSLTQIRQAALVAALLKYEPPTKKSERSPKEPQLKGGYINKKSKKTKTKKKKTKKKKTKKRKTKKKKTKKKRN
jgi:hypothetical protein